jgi:hypothetical protein
MPLRVMSLKFYTFSYHRESFHVRGCIGAPLPGWQVPPAGAGHPLQERDLGGASSAKDGPPSESTQAVVWEPSFARRVGPGMRAAAPLSPPTPITQTPATKTLVPQSMRESNVQRVQKWPYCAKIPKKSGNLLTTVSSAPQNSTRCGSPADDGRRRSAWRHDGKHTHPRRREAGLAVGLASTGSGGVESLDGTDPTSGSIRPSTMQLRATGLTRRQTDDPTGFHPSKTCRAGTERTSRADPTTGVRRHAPRSRHTGSSNLAP